MVEGESKGLEGLLLGGHYRVGPRIGEGTFGFVHRATHELLGTSLAIKILRPEFVGDPVVRRRFLDEARALARLVHENVVPVRHVGEDGERLFLAMDFLEGESLHELLQREGALGEERAVRLTRQILQGLSAAHRKDIVHRDLKPSNVFISRDGEQDESVCLLDFGLSKLLGRKVAGVEMSMPGTIIGTLSYMAPEQLGVGEEVDQRADLFAVGLLLYEMLKGEHPFPGEEGVGVALKLCHHPVPPLEEVNGRTLRKATRDALAGALQRETESRFADAEAFLNVLDGAALASVAAPPPPAPAHRTRPRRRLWIAAGIAVAAALAIWRATSPGFDPLRAEADGLMLQGKMLAALKRLDQLIDSDEATGRDHLARARVRIELRHADALGDIEAARARGAKKRDLYLARARYHTYVADDPEEASKWLRLAIREAPDGPEPYEMRARYVLATPGPGRTEQAKRDALQLQRILPQDPVGWSLEGRAAAQASTNASPEERKRLWLRTELVLAEARKRDDDATSCDVPWLEAELGHARQAYAWSQTDIPTFHMWRNREVAAYTRALERARRHPQRRRQGLHIFDLLQARGDTYLGPDFWKTGDAVEDFLELERLGPRGTATLYRVGYALMEAGRYEEAIERFRRVLAIDPRHVDSVDFLGFCNLNLGRRALLGGDRDAAVHYWDDAVAAYDARQRLRQDDVDIEYRAETRTLIARYGPPERRQKEIAAAEADFDRRIQQVRAAGGVAVEARYRRSFLLTLQGDEEGAFEDARLGAIYNPSVTPAMLNRYAELALRRAVARGRGELDLVRSALEAADRAVKRSAVFQDRGVRYAYPRRARAYVLLAVHEQKPEARERWLRKAAADATEIERLTTEKEYEFLTVVAAIRARVALARGEATKALAHARRAVELHEQAVKDHLALPQPRPYELLVEALRAAGEKSEADPVARKAARVRRDWPPP